MAIVPFQQSHVDGFRSLVSETLREFGFALDPELDADLTDPAATYAALWVAMDDGSVVGSVALRDLGEGAVELKRMYLRPDQRGHGLGRQLLELALDWARGNEMRLVRLDTSERMVAAQRLYEAYGFERTAGDAPRQGQCRLLYELRLS
jgi:GNAT superfamily N-acetyltransferase